MTSATSSKGFEQRYKGAAFSGPQAGDGRQCRGALERQRRRVPGCDEGAGRRRLEHGRRAPSISTLVGASQSRPARCRRRRRAISCSRSSRSRSPTLPPRSTAQGRAEMLDAARAAAAEAEGRERFRRFRKGN
jgi:hypothetical protein